ncbi:hypothetical protein F4861DRAFT_542779 [Xylaria intraflava]|nr:hypothetical protein F4861DRAFT_542779 [Xylaria intraflava]
MAATTPDSSPTTPGHAAINPRAPDHGLINPSAPDHGLINPGAPGAPGRAISITRVEIIIPARLDIFWNIFIFKILEGDTRAIFQIKTLFHARRH